MEPSKDPDVLRKPLTLVVQLPEFAQLDVAQRRPTAEEKDIRSSRSRLASPSSVSSSTERFLGRFSITWAAIPQRPMRQRRMALWPALCRVAQPLPNPRGQAARDLHRHLASAALGAVARRSTRKRGSGNAMVADRRGARSPGVASSKLAPRGRSSPYPLVQQLGRTSGTGFAAFLTPRGERFSVGISIYTISTAVPMAVRRGAPLAVRPPPKLRPKRRR